MTHSKSPQKLPDLNKSTDRRPPISRMVKSNQISETYLNSKNLISEELRSIFTDKPSRKSYEVIRTHSLSSSPVISNKAYLSLNNVSDLGAAIRVARRDKGLTQQDFADLAGVGRRFLSELEHGKQTLEIGKVIKVAAAAGIQLMFSARE